MKNVRKRTQNINRGRDWKWKDEWGEKGKWKGERGKGKGERGKKRKVI